MTPGAGQALGNGLGGSGGGGGGVDDGPTPIFGGSVNGWDTALSKCAHPEVATLNATAAHAVTAAARTGPGDRMLARLRTRGGRGEFAYPDCGVKSRVWPRFGLTLAW